MENNEMRSIMGDLTPLLKDELAKTADKRGLTAEERAVIHEKILMNMERDWEKEEEAAASPEAAFNLAMMPITMVFMGYLMLGWIRLGFLPSQLPNEIDLTATFRRYVPSLSNPSGESRFWDGIVWIEMSDMEKSKTAFDLCSHDTALLPWMQMTAMQITAWHHVRLNEYDAARQTLERLRDLLVESKTKADYLIGYINAMEDSGLPYDDCFEQFIMVSEGMPERAIQCLTDKEPQIETFTKSLQFTPSTIEALTRAIAGEFEPRMRLALWETKEEIVKVLPMTRAVEEVGQRLRNEHGDWVRKLANQGSLINAEFLYEALKARSWGGAITEYASAVEAEIKAKLLPWLENFLGEKRVTLANILDTNTERGGSSLGYAEIVLTRIAQNQILEKFLSDLPEDTVSFLLRELPASLAKLRELRNPPAHGEVIPASRAIDVRRLVLGTPQKPGLLKRLNEVSQGLCL